MKCILTVLGRDRVGIIAGVCTELANRSINVLDINQTVMQGCFTMMMMIDTEASPLTFTELCEELEQYGREHELTVRVQREDIFSAMHRI